MNRLLPAGIAVVVVLAVSAIAYAQSATNVYNVTASTNPTKSGTKSKPKPISAKFNFRIGEAQNRRPATVSQITVAIPGAKVSTSGFATCTSQKINAAQSDDDCPSKSVIGTGFANNIAGNATNQSDTSLRCYLKVTLYNGGSNRASLFVEGDPNAAAPKNCVIKIATAIPARWINSSKGTSLQFSIPSNLQQPVPGVANALVETEVTVKKLTRKSKGKTIGYLSTTGGCSGGERNVTARFVTVGGGAPATAQGEANCSK